MTLLKFIFLCIYHLCSPIIKQNQKRGLDDDVFHEPIHFLKDMKEFDIPYTIRISIDLDLRVGAWFEVSPSPSSSLFCQVEWKKEMLELCEPKILAFDIECEKAPLKFPNAEHDRIFMISYMVSGQGYLLINREIVSEDIQDFEYTPLPKYPGLFQVVNLPNEKQLLEYFIQHILQLRPHVIVTYNGDFFDWPYVDSRCSSYGISLYQTLGIRKSSSTYLYASLSFFLSISLYVSLSPLLYQWMD